MESQTTTRRFSFHLSSSTGEHPTEPLKRGRPATDVDGPNTSSMSCKKRRLRLELITSRLSQPFSLPATHILNREGLARGDKRFAKMGACASMVKRGLSFNASSSPFWRVALLNRTRLQTRDARIESLGNFMSRAMATSSKHPMTSWHQGALVQNHDGTRRPPSRPPPLAAVQQFAQTLPRPPSALRPRISIPPSPTSPSTEATPYRLCLVSASPVSDYVEDEDDGEAFPTANHTSMYDNDDHDDVYSDFAMIFGPGAAAESANAEPGVEPGAEGDEHSYDEYLDELDGIAWVACRG
jgi:hypothetical protein